MSVGRLLVELSCVGLRQQPGYETLLHDEDLRFVAKPEPL
jgi:hypothetical protein